MITVKVSYTVKPAFVIRNKQNIHTFLMDFKQMNAADFRYNIYLMDDGLTFVHFTMYKNEAVQKEVLNVPSFLHFQRERDASDLGDSHKVEMWTLIGSSTEMLS